MLPDFELIPHTADLQIRVYGATQAELFKHALIGMFQAIGPEAANCTYLNNRLVCKELNHHHNVTIQAYDIEQLLVDFLSQALYLSDVHNEAYLDVTIKDITPTRIKATLHGVTVTSFEVVEIKAVTYHNLAITQHNSVWQTDIVFDI